MLALLMLAASLAVVPGTHAGTPQDPEVADPEGDQQTSAGPLVLDPDGFDDVDILAAWVHEDFDVFGEAERLVGMGVQLAAAPEEDTQVVLAFQVQSGPRSLPNSTAAGETYEITITGGTVSGVPDAQLTVNDNGMVGLAFPKAEIGAVAGDRLTNLTVTTARSSSGTVMPPVTQDDESGSDAAGPGRDYTFFRPPLTHAVLIEIIGGNKNVDGTPQGFEGFVVEADHGDQEFEVRYRIQNLGSDPDTFAVGATGSAGIGPLPEIAATFELDSNEAEEGTWSFRLDDARQNVTLTLTATASDGTSDSAVLTVLVPEAVLPDAREVYPAGLDFMTPVAEWSGLDDTLGDHAELFAFAILVLLFFILVFLLLFLRRPLPIAAAVEAPPIEPAKAFAAGVTGRHPARSRTTAAASVETEGAQTTAPTTAGDAMAAPAMAGHATGHAKGVELDVVHSPEDPDFADRVTTTAVVRNMRKEDRRLRVVLRVDGKAKVEEEIEVVARGSREVRLPWLAGPGKNAASVEVHEACRTKAPTRGGQGASDQAPTGLPKPSAGRPRSRDWLGRDLRLASPETCCWPDATPLAGLVR
jgi:hypothetical protein